MFFIVINKYMSLNLENLFYEEREVGKTFSSSKKYYLWEFKLNNRHHKVEMYHSRVSMKKKLCIDEKIICEKESYKNTFEYTFILSNHRFQVIQLKSDKFDLRIDGISFGMLMVEEKNGNLKKHYQQQNQPQEEQIKRSMTTNTYKPNSKFEMMPSFLRSKSIINTTKTSKSENTGESTNNQNSNVLLDFGSSDNVGVNQMNPEIFNKNQNILNSINLFNNNSNPKPQYNNDTYNQPPTINNLSKSQNSNMNFFMDKNDNNVISNNSNILSNLNTNNILGDPQPVYNNMNINLNTNMNNVNSIPNNINLTQTVYPQYSNIPEPNNTNDQLLGYPTPQNSQNNLMNSFNSGTNMNMNMGNIQTYTTNQSNFNSNISQNNPVLSGQMNITWNTQSTNFNNEQPIMINQQNNQKQNFFQQEQNYNIQNCQMNNQINNDVNNNVNNQLNTQNQGNQFKVIV